MPRIEGKSGDGVQAALLALNIIEILAKERRAVGVTALAQALGTTKSRIHRHLQTLVQLGYIVHPEDSDRYESGPRLTALARIVMDKLDLSHVARDPLLELRDALGHSAVVSQIAPDGMQVLATVLGQKPIEIGVRAGSLLPFHCSAQGKVTLAFSTQEFRDRVLRGQLEKMTPETVVDPALLAAELDVIREQGWATAANQTAIGLNTLAAPIYDSTDAVCGTVAVVDVVQSIPKMPSEEQRSRVVAAASRISRALGNGGF